MLQKQITKKMYFILNTDFVAKATAFLGMLNANVFNIGKLFFLFCVYIMIYALVRRAN